MKIVLFILGIFVGLLLIALLKALLLKPTSAKDAKVTLDTSVRSIEYGEKLAKMVQCETISCRDQEDRSKFLEFHKVLEEVFPNVHKECEKHVFNGSLLYKWTGKHHDEPILLIEHIIYIIFKIFIIFNHIFHFCKIFINNILC